MTYGRKSKIVIMITLAITLMISWGTAAMGAYSVPGTQTVIDNNSFETEEKSSTEAAAEGIRRKSYYSNFQATTNADTYKMSGTLYQNKNPRSLVWFETLPDKTLTVNGRIEAVEGEFQLVYHDSDGTTVILAEGKAEDGEPILIDYEVETSGKGEFYFEASSAICEFDLELSKTDEITYYLSNKNPIGLIGGE